MHWFFQYKKDIPRKLLTHKKDIPRKLLTHKKDIPRKLLTHKKDILKKLLTHKKDILRKLLTHKKDILRKLLIPINRTYPGYYLPIKTTVGHTDIQTWVKLNDLPISSGGDINKTIKKQLIQDQNNKV